MNTKRFRVVCFVLTASQLNALLELVPGAATLYDAADVIVAQNQAAASPASAMSSSTPHLHPLGEGWQLRHVPELAAFPISDGMTLLVRGMAHEIRNPLSAILTALDLVGDDPALSEESAMLLGIVRKEARRMNHILTEFSSYVKPQSPQPAPFDLAALARRVVAQMRQSQTLPPHIEIDDTLPEQLPAVADESQIAHALSRVLHNAVDAMPHGGTLRLCGGGHDSHGNPCVTICLADTGPGFSSEALERAFQPFYSTKPHDTGLGLSIAQAAVEAAGGRMWLENLRDVSNDAPSAPNDKPVQGARVWLQLPETPSQA